MILTVNQLEAASPYTHFRRIELILPNFNATCEKYGINNPFRVAHFLTQILVESNHFRHIQEVGNGSIYEGNKVLGNTEKGDGRKFIGRGYIKLLGRLSYEEYKQASGVDTIAYPHVVTTPRIAMDIAGWLWNKLGLNELADKDDLPEITRRLTGAYLILREREEMLNKVKRAIGTR